MKILSRAEELVLLSIWHLQENAYIVLIREHLIRVTGKKWSFGTVYDPLDRLEKKKFLKSYFTEPIPERGGRSKRVYSLTREGKQALKEIKRVADSMWANIPILELKEEK